VSLETLEFYRFASGPTELQEMFVLRRGDGGRISSGLSLLLVSHISGQAAAIRNLGVLLHGESVARNARGIAG
jgi:hypothetical protein